MKPWIYSIILAELLIVSWVDIKTKKISNIWLLTNLGLGVVIHALYPELYHLEWSTLIYPTAWILAGFALFNLGIMGAGDSKLLASLFLLVPLTKQFLMLEKIMYSTIVVGMVFLTIKIAKDFEKIKAYAFSSYWKGLKESIRSNFSYAPVVLLAWILFGVEQWL